MNVDTHALFKEFVALGFTEGQAEYLSKLHVHDDRNYSTKEQIDLLERDQIDIKTDIKIIKSDIANIKDMIKWMMAIFLTNTGLVIAILTKLVF